jgi:hypothetical protein
MKMKGMTIGMCGLVLLVFLLSAGGAGAQPATVLFDQGHGEMFGVDKDGPLQLSALAERFGAEGFTVRTGNETLTADQLSGIDALIVSGPFVPLAPEEIEDVLRFVMDGGHLAVMLHIGPPALSLLHRLGVDVANGVVREVSGLIDEEPLDFYVADLSSHPLTLGLRRIAVFGSWAVTGFGEGTEILARTGPKAWVDLDRDQKLGRQDAVQAFGIAVAGRLGNGRFVVFGDDAIFQNRFLAEHNAALADNLVRWLGRP